MDALKVQLFKFIKKHVFVSKGSTLPKEAEHCDS